MKIEYPKWLYHKTESPKIVQTKEEQDEAGKGWKEVPFAVVEEKSTESELHADLNDEASVIEELDHILEEEIEHDKKPSKKSFPKKGKDKSEKKDKKPMNKEKE